MSVLLEVEQLEVSFGGRTSAVRGASLAVERGETHCLVGESGCGKSVTSLSIMRLVPSPPGTPHARLAGECRQSRHLRLHRRDRLMMLGARDSSRKS